MGLPPHDDGVVQGFSSLSGIEAAAGLAWLAAAGVDVLVDDTPRNWLAAPAPRGTEPGLRGAVPPARTDTRTRTDHLRIAPPLAVARAAAADSLAALDAALIDFDHPLRRAGTAPRLVMGNTASGILVFADQPDADDSPAARLRARMLAAIGLAPANHATGALLPWATTGVRPVRDAEVADFAPFVARAIELMAPRCILALGDRAAALSGPVRGIASARGRWLAVGDVPLLATFHPRQLLAQPELKLLAWADLQAFAKRLPGRES